jgi:hypothetical protein
MSVSTEIVFTLEDEDVDCCVYRLANGLDSIGLDINTLGSTLCVGVTMGVEQFCQSGLTAP